MRTPEPVPGQRSPATEPAEPVRSLEEIFLPGAVDAQDAVAGTRAARVLVSA
ncbi:MAG: hypothetical protein ACRYG8_18870 [Janthinobacterium lividum]